MQLPEDDPAALADGLTCKVTAATATSEAQRRERVRVQELLRYFHRPLAREQDLKTPRLATDTTLTVFAQLSAVRLNCQRGFISLMDNQKQYIIAEATRTVSLKFEDVRDNDDDAIFLGQTILDFDWGVCPGTIASFTALNDSLDISTPLVKASRSHYVMNDMSALEDYKDRPYIKGWPFMKYYAEVPIHSPSGITIGTLCVVDSKSREGLDLKGLAILQEISEAVMDHLELRVSKLQRSNAERMIQALGHFVEGGDSVQELGLETQAPQANELRSDHPSTQIHTETALGSEVAESPPEEAVQTFETVETAAALPDTATNPVKPIPSLQPRQKCQDNVESPDELDHSQSQVDSKTTKTIPDPVDKLLNSSETVFPTTTGAPTGKDAETSSATPIQDLQTPSLRQQRGEPRAPSFEQMLSRATNLIREGISSDGVVFFDPRSIDGVLLSDLHAHGEKVIWSERRQSVTPSSVPIKPPLGRSRSSLDSVPVLSAVRYCKAMASSVRDALPPNGLDFHSLITETSLQYFLRQFPSGGVLYYDEDGLIGQSDQIFVFDAPRNQTPFDPPKEFSENQFMRDTPQSIWEANQLRLALPGVTSVLLFPLWDTTRDKWLSYGMAWTTDPNRVFQREEFSYLASFSNSIMAEMSRLETTAADKAKAGFISSISHELRSPLHGIMASVEFLRDVISDPIVNDIARTVESCGSTLLDTIDNLLSFAKISRVSSAEANDGTQKNLLDGDDRQSIDLGVLVEDIMQISIAGHYFHKSVESSDIKLKDKNDPGLTIICDIASSSDWLIRTNRGIWKQILMNLLGNSLKYTQSGFIIVKLRLEENTVESTTAANAMGSSTLEPGMRMEKYRSKSSLSNGSWSGNGALDVSLNATSALPATMTMNTDPDWSTTSPSRQKPKTFNVMLSVEDSGKGISPEYLTHHLFKPFYQEDSLSPGTGLGLSIVSQLATSIGGVTKVTSELGIGTTVRIDALLECPDVGESAPSLPSKPSQFQYMRLGLFGLDPVPCAEETPARILGKEARAIQAIRSTLINYASLLGVSVIYVDSIESSAADIIIVPEVEYWRILRASKRPVNNAVIILAAEPFLSHSITQSFGFALVLSQPFGPRKFQKVLESSISRKQAQPQSGTHSPARRPNPIENIPRQSMDSVPMERLSLDTPAKGEEAIPNEPRSHHVKSRRPTALLVEDNPINLKLLSTFFKKMDHDFHTATNGAQAVEAYRNADGNFDIIFMDIQMPVMDGMEASIEIRKHERQNEWPYVVIIALTALNSLDAKQAAMDSGVDRFLSKPISMKEIKKVVEECWKPVPS